VHTQRKDEDARRAFWTEQMDLAYEFVESILEYPVKECGQALVSLPETVKREGISVLFSDTKIVDDYNRIFYLREGLIETFVSIARDMNNRGWTLKVEDGFRSRAMQKNVALKEKILDIILQKVIWENNGEIPKTEFMFKRLTVLVATFPKIGTHMSGSAIDISVFRTEDLVEIDRGGPYLEMSELTPMSSPFVSVDAAQNRAKISEVMQRHGFIAYPYEFWHYSKDDAYSEYLTNSGKTAQYGPVDFDLVSGSITPILRTKAPLHSLEDIKTYIELGLNRLNLNKQK